MSREQNQLGVEGGMEISGTPKKKHGMVWVITDRYSYLLSMIFNVQFLSCVYKKISVERNQSFKWILIF